jgi:glutamate 5-kinase
MKYMKGRLVVRIEISTLFDEKGKLNHQKMDRLAMVLSNLHNSGKEILMITSGAIVLGAEKLGVGINMDDFPSMMAAAAIGQAELIKLYQRYFDQYNQMVAQVLLTGDIMNNSGRRQNTENTFEKLLGMNIIPIINENDAVSTSDIELDDNYPLALNVAKVVKADIILIKSDVNSNYIIQPRNNFPAVVVENEQDLFCKLDEWCTKLSEVKDPEYVFPDSIEEMAL